MKWYLFSHPIAGKDTKPFIGAHLARVYPVEEFGKGVVDYRYLPACGAMAMRVLDVDNPSGFIVACCRCLALSEAS